jgi:hypothetical protein
LCLADIPRCRRGRVLHRRRGASGLQSA